MSNYHTLAVQLAIELCLVLRSDKGIVSLIEHIYKHCLAELHTEYQP